MANVEFGMTKTAMILGIVGACFAILWPKIFYPMLTASSNKKLNSDNMDGCCNVIFETDINAIKIITEMCGTILSRQEDFNPKLSQSFQQGKLTKEVINFCRSEVMNTCGIDIAEFLSKKEKLGHTYKQMLDEIRSFNISICLRHNFGVNPGLLGAPRRMRIWETSVSRHLRQERPLHFRPEIIHPALREKGRAIPQSHVVPRVSNEREPNSRQMPIPGTRPPMGGAGHVVPPPKVGGTMSIIMPLYTIGIVVFFMYTVMKVIMKKTGGNDGLNDFQSDPEFRRVVFSEDFSNGCAARIREAELEEKRNQETPHIWKSSKDDSTRLGDIEIDQLRKRLEETEKAMERIVAQMETVPPELKIKTQIPLRCNPSKEKTNLDQVNEEIQAVQKKDLESYEQTDTTARVHKEVLGGSKEGDNKPKVKVMGLELMAECEGGQKWSRPATPNLGVGGSSRSTTPIPPFSPEPQNIFLEGSLPQQSQLLVTDSKTQAVTLPDADEPEPPVILSSKMTLSLISLDAAFPEENFGPDQPALETHDDNKTENFGNRDSALCDPKSEIIDEIDQFESFGIQEEESTKLRNLCQEADKMKDDQSENYKTESINEKEEVELTSEIKDTTANPTNIGDLDLTEDHEDFQTEEIHLWNGSVKEEAQEKGSQSQEEN